jgi:hypothetical protein
VKVRRARAGHAGNQSTTSRSGSTGGAGFSGPSKQILILPSGSSSTVPAPACFAARIDRATSAWVKRAGVRLILSIDLMGSRIDYADDSLAAFMDMNVFDPNVLVAATAQAPVSLDLGAKGPQQFGRCRCQAREPLRTAPGAADP